VSLTSPASLLNLASGTHSYRVWTDGTHAFKAALTDPDAETSITTDGTQVWVWSSPDNTVWHATPSPQAGPPARPTPPPTPDEIAQRILTSIEPTTTVTTSGTATVAGRPAYTLLLTPQDAATSIGSIAINVDAATKLPLAVHVTARGATSPALSVAFTSLKLGTPSPSTFTFTPPAGATVKELPAEQPPVMHPGSAGQPGTTQPGAKEPASSGASQPVITGTGWSAVAVWQTPASMIGSAGSSSSAGLLKVLPRVSGSWGSGYLISSTLGSAVLTDDGRIAVGAVGPDQLYSALAR
jgi:outer membrane lipoprotein-sorting protein